MRNTALFLSAGIVLTGCSSPGGPYPSLQPRAAEAIDPRVQPVRPLNARPVTPALASELARLVDEARSGNAAFQPAAANAERLANGAGAPQSETWITAQEALTVAIAARRPTAMAQADIDTITATALQRQGGIAPKLLRAINNAAAQVAAIAGSQTSRIDVVKKRLGL